MAEKNQVILQDMTTKELNDTLREEGRFLGMCDEFYNEKWDFSLEQLVERMFKGIDFCLQHHWPSNEFIKKNFKRDFLREQGIFVDDEYSICNVQESLVLGGSKVRYRYSGKYYGNIRVRDLSLVEVTARGDGLVIVHLFERACAKVERSEKAKVAIIKHSPKVLVSASEGVRIVEEYDYLE